MDIAISGEAQVKWSNSTRVKNNFPENSIKESFTSGTSLICAKAKEMGHREIEKKKRAIPATKYIQFSVGALSPTQSVTKDFPKKIYKQEMIKHTKKNDNFPFKNKLLNFDIFESESMCIILGSSVDGILPSIRPITSGIFQRRTNFPATVGPAIIPIITTSNCNKSKRVPKLK